MDIFEIDRQPGSLTLFMSPKLRYIDRAGDETERFLAEEAPGVTRFNVLLIMREALTNAVLYGSRHEEHSRIRYSLRSEAGRLSMEVEDDGDGFDWKSRSRELPGIESESGRGMSIMNAFSSGFTYNDRGNCLSVIWLEGAALSTEST